MANVTNPNDDDLQPLFAVLSAGSRPFASALQIQVTEPVASPWLPQGTQPGAKTEAITEGASILREQELAELRAKAVEAGRAEGLRETAVLRDALKTMVIELAAARDAKIGKTAETIAACAIAAIEGFVQTAPKQELFEPVVRGWIARAGSVQAVAKVHPNGVAALQGAIGDAPITIETDPAMQPNDLAIRSESLDTTHAWAERLRELRDVIATALEQESA